MKLAFEEQCVQIAESKWRIGERAVSIFDIAREIDAGGLSLPTIGRVSETLRYIVRSLREKDIPAYPIAEFYFRNEFDKHPPETEDQARLSIPCGNSKRTHGVHFVREHPDLIAQAWGRRKASSGIGMVRSGQRDQSIGGATQITTGEVIDRLQIKAGDENIDD